MSGLAVNFNINKADSPEVNKHKRWQGAEGLR
jgi:hypothetical protein